MDAHNPQSYQWFGSYRALDKKTQLLFNNEVNSFLNELQSNLEIIEIDCNSLTSLYRGHPEVSTTLTISNLANKKHEITWYDDNDGNIIQAEIKNGTSITIESPIFRKHIAFIIK